MFLHPFRIDRSPVSFSFLSRLKHGLMLIVYLWARTSVLACEFGAKCLTTYFYALSSNWMMFCVRMLAKTLQIL